MPLSTTSNATNSSVAAAATPTTTVAAAAPSSVNFEYTTTNIPAFLSKLWTLVEDPKFDELIAWDPAGFSFHVFDQTRFSREILPRFFKHNNMASFIRQLNMYGFRKVNSIDHGSLKSEKEDMEFHHPYFIKGKEQFLEFIKRKVPDLKTAATNQNQQQQQQQTAITTAASANQTAAMLQYSQIKQDEINKVLDDVNTIKSRQKVVDESLYSVKKENEALWKEIASLRQKHHHQQQIVNKLIHFLIHLVNPSSLGLKRTRPLMIDSHSASKFANLEADNLDFNNGGDINDYENEEDEEYVMQPVAKTVVRGQNVAAASAGSNQQTSSSAAVATKRANVGHIVEIDDSEEDQRRGGSRYLTTEDSGEIETINISKNKKSAEDEDDEDEAPTTKRFRAMKQQMADLNKNNGNEKKPVSTDASGDVGGSDFLDANLFLNTTGMQQKSCTESIKNQASPIVTTPASPLELSNNTNNNNNNNNSSLLITEASQNSPNQMNEHVESLQLDLNSIKEFLTQNSFSNQIDPYTLNNLFSPNVLDQIENEPFYIEAPEILMGGGSSSGGAGGAGPISLSSSSSSRGVNQNSSNQQQRDSPVTNTSVASIVEMNPPAANSAANNGGKIIGNELIQYEPFNVTDYIQLDDLLSESDYKTPTVNVNKSTNASLQAPYAVSAAPEMHVGNNNNGRTNQIVDALLLNNSPDFIVPVDASTVGVYTDAMAMGNQHASLNTPAPNLQTP